MKTKYFPQPDTYQRKTYVVEDSARLQFRAKLLEAVIIQKDSNWEMFLHSHDFVEVMLVVNGSGKVLTDGIESAVSEGDVVVYNKGCEHGEYTLDSSITVYFASFNNVEIPGLPPGSVVARGTPNIFKSGDMFDTFKNLFDNIYAEMREKPLLHSEVVLHASRLLFVYLMRLIRKGQETPKPLTQEDTLRQVVEYIDKNYKRNLSLQQIADDCHLNKFYLEHMFSKHQSITLNRYITNKKINEAGRLLRETDLPSKEIAEICGFNDPNYFSRVFRKMTGKTPREHRQFLKISENE